MTVLQSVGRRVARALIKELQPKSRAARVLVPELFQWVPPPGQATLSALVCHAVHALVALVSHVHALVAPVALYVHSLLCAYTHCSVHALVSLVSHALVSHAAHALKAVRGRASQPC